MKLNFVEAIIAISEAGSIRAAAARTGKSQPALTKILQQMEAELGVSLFRRTSRGVVTTDMGKTVLKSARAVSRELSRLHDEIAQLQGHQVGSVRVCVSPLGAIRILPRAMAMFRLEFPEINVHVQSGLYPESLQALREGQIDMIIGPVPPSEYIHDLNAEPLLETKVIVITSRKSKDAQARSLVELQGSNWIMLGRPEGPGDILEHLFRNIGLEPPAVFTTSESYFGALALVEQLDAVCTFPEKLLEQINGQQDVVAVPIKEEIPHHMISLVTRTDRPLTPAAAELAKHILRRAAAISDQL